MTVIMTAPVGFTPGAWASTGGMGEGRPPSPSSRVEVTVRNDTGTPLTATSVMSEATAGDREIPSVIDSDQGIDWPSTDILPGRSLTWSQGFAVAPTVPFDVQVDVMFSLHGVYRQG